jgi:hypothetical protein
MDGNSLSQTAFDGRLYGFVLTGFIFLTIGWQL